MECPRSRHRRLLASLAGRGVLARIGLVAVACGAIALTARGESDEDRIREVVREYHDASVEGDIKRTCELLGPRVHAGMDGGCIAYVGERFGEFGEADLSHLQELADSGSIAVRADRATVSTDADDISLVEVDGDWKIDGSDNP